MSQKEDELLTDDLPEDRSSSSVLLLGVTRIPTSPLPARRPCSLPIESSDKNLTTDNTTAASLTASVRRTSFSSRRQIVRRTNSNSSVKKRGTVEKSLKLIAKADGVVANENVEKTECGKTTSATETTFTDGVELESVEHSDTISTSTLTNNCNCKKIHCLNCNNLVSTTKSIVTSSNTNESATSGTVMDRSVDSIGTCSLDVEASADLSDWSEASSGGTLRSASLKSTPTTVAEANSSHLPSYLSLACTVNGYSTTTNYDPIRLARSRDASPHRFDHHHQYENHLTPLKNTQFNNNTYSIQNNLLSPPNLVPLPTLKPKMSDHITTLTQHHHHHEFYRSSTTSTTIKSMSFKSSESSHFSATNGGSGLFSSDTIDACYENGSSNRIKNHHHFSNGKAGSTTTIKEFSSSTNGTEVKSFIQQRVERLYGPGALAQGFFLTPKKQKNQSDEHHNDDGTLHERIIDKLKKIDNNECNSNNNSDAVMKQSTSSPALPVLRHLTPEFRAQLPIISPRKSSGGAGSASIEASNNVSGGSMQKSSTAPTLKDEVLNGHGKIEPVANNKDVIGNMQASAITEESGEKDGHYFLRILQNETNRLLKLADKAEAELTSNDDLNEEVIGKIHSAAGKARLLVSQKMQQFKGLCTNNITQSDSEAFPTTNEDLQGFWDMVMLQVDQVDALLKEIDDLKANNWEEIKVEKKVSKSSLNGRATPKKVVSKVKLSATNEEARKKREAERKQMIEERRKAMKAAQQQQNCKPVENIEIFVPESS